MKVRVPRAVIVSVAALFSAYHLVLAAYALPQGYSDPVAPVIAAMALYGVATIAVLVPGRTTRMPIWFAAAAVGVAISVPLLVSATLDPQRPGGNGYATWYVAAVGTLMTITAVRYRPGFAWAGIAFLVLHTIIWAGPLALPAIGVIGSCGWVAIAHLLTNALAKAVRDSQRFAAAEREAAEWQAAQEAHVNERQRRLAHTTTMAMPMLRAIREQRGELTAEQREECLHLEGAIRDEIRGRHLLDDAVREEVMRARRRGTTVTLLDEGGIDDLDEAELARVHGAIAAALRGVRADKVIVRTVPEGSDVAVTVVGLDHAGDGSASALGQDEAEEIALWLEIPRTAPEGAEEAEGAAEPAENEPRGRA